MLFQKQSLQQFFLTTLALCVVLLVSGRVGAEVTERDAMNYFFDSSFKNLKEEAELAKQEGKQGIFVMFSDEDCPWCLKMKTTILNQVSVQDYYRKHFRILHIDTKGDTMMADFSGKEISEKDFAFKVNRVRATPVFMIFDLYRQRSVAIYRYGTHHL